MIQAEQVSFSYEYEESNNKAIKDASFTVSPGEFVAVLGCNGSGKSTLAKLMNGLLPLQGGTLKVCGFDVSEESTLWQLRRNCGMVFQNPDNQFVSTIIQEDIAFGLENYHVPKEEIPARVREALDMVGLQGYELRSPHSLSGGQKQRVALAGVLALKPKLIIFDEATSMLDPEGRNEVRSMIKQLHKQGTTIVMITHYVEEAAGADTVMLMKAGEIFAWGESRKILTDQELLSKGGLKPPAAVDMFYSLAQKGIRLSKCPLTNRELEEELCRLF